MNLDSNVKFISDVKANICAGLETLKVEGEGRARLEEGGFRSSSNENLVGEKTATNGRSGGEALGERSKKEAVNTTKVAKVKKRQQVEARLQQRKQLEDLLFENNNHNNRPLHDNNSNNNNNNNNRTNDNFPNNHYKHYYKESRNQLRRRQKQLGIENKRRRRRDMSC